MEILDSNQINAASIQTDVCIVGAGPAGMILAKKLGESKLHVVIADSGGKKYEEKPNELNLMNVDSNFLYRNGESNRARQIGGTASIWAGRVVPFHFDSQFDQEWGDLQKAVKPYFDDAFWQLNLNPEIQKTHDHFKNDLYGYWAFRTQRFKPSIFRSNSKNAQIYTNLTFTGGAEFNGDQITEMFFINQKKQEIKIRSHLFVFAMGGIENSRMLLIMSNQLKKRMGENFQNVGKYIMDHPRVSHGTLVPRTDANGLSKYIMKSTRFGIYKTGIRNNANSTRVYCNLLGAYGRITRRILRLRFKGFQNSSKRLLIKEAGILRTLANQCHLLPWIGRSDMLSNYIVQFVNSQSFTKYRLLTYCEQRPRFQNQIILDHRTDKINLKIPKLINNIHTEELKEVSTFYRSLENQAEFTGSDFQYDEDYIRTPSNYTDASHIMGGTRYSVDRSKAVVDENLRILGVTNLHITGSSVFPTSGIENPTHLISSLSLYLAGIIKDL